MIKYVTIIFLKIHWGLCMLMWFYIVGMVIITMRIIMIIRKGDQLQYCVSLINFIATGPCAC